MNNDIVILREAIKKLIPMIAGRGLRVTQMGTQAYVAPNPQTGLPERVNIPNIPDNASSEFVQAIQGFIDHEVAHVLYTDFLCQAGNKTPRLHNLHNIVEDTRIERCMADEFPGSRKNIDRLSRYFIENVTAKAIDSAKDPMEEFQYLIVVMMRALAGHVPFQEFMDDRKYWDHPLVKAFLDKFPEAVRKRMPHLASTQEAFDVAVEMEKILYPPPPPAPPQPEPEENDDDEQSDSSDGDTDDQSDDSGAGDDSSEEQDGKPEKGDGDAEDDADSSNDENEGEQSDDDGKDSDAGEADEDDDAEGKDGKGEGEREHTDETDSDQASGGEDDEENEDGSDNDTTESGQGSENGDDPQDDDGQAGKSGDDKDTDDAGDADDDDRSGDTAEDTADEGADESEGDDANDGEEASDDQGEDDGADGSDESDGDAEASSDAADNESSDDDGADGPAGDDGADGSEDDLSDSENGGQNDVAVELDLDDQLTGEAPERKEEAADDTDISGVGYAGDDPFREMRDDALDEVDISSSISIIIQRHAIDAINASDYSVFTREFDLIKPLEVPTDFSNKRVVELDEQTRTMTGVMQKDIERMMAAQSRVFNIGGQRSGRLNGAGLHRLVANDPRVFARREEIRAKDTAVMLLNDCSGSMRGSKVSTAMASSFALSTTLERVNIPHEVMGFTTGGHWGCDIIPQHVGQKAQDMARADESKSGVRFCRTVPIYMPIFKEFHERLNSEVKRRFAYMRHVQPNLGANVDGESLEYAAMRLARRKEKRKVIIVLSDGFPAGARNDDEHLMMMTRKLTGLGFDLVGIGIESAAVERFYENNLVLKSVEELPGAVMGKLRAILQK